jgi:prophage antirepressor-like protein
VGGGRGYPRFAGKKPPPTPSGTQWSVHTIRVVNIDDNPWFVGSDVCRILTLNTPKDAYARLDMTEKTYEDRTLFGLSPGKQMVLISESGLYKLIMRSDKPLAKPFQDWVTKEVLPSIRKNGGYVKDQEKVS